MDENMSSRWQQPHCQCCLGDIFLEDFSTENCYEEMLWNVFSIFVASDIGGKQICASCVQSLRAAANFKALVLKSQQILQTTGQDVKNECIINIEIKREDTSNAEDAEEVFEVPVASTIKTEALPVQVEPTPDGAGGTKRRAVKRKTGKKPEKNISTDDVSAGRSDASPDVAEEETPKKIPADQPTTASGPTEPKKRKRRTLRPEYEALKKTDVVLATNSNMTLFRWSKQQVIRCLFCEDTFTDATLLKQHTLTHRQDLAEKINRNKQNRYIRADVTDLKCGQCQKDIKDVKDLIQHLESTHQVKFPTRESLLIPYRLDELACVECGQKFETFGPLHTHMSTHYSKSVCDKCGKHFRSANDLQRHLRQTHTDIVLKCDLCDATFDSYYRKKKHAKENHGASAGRDCPHCNESFLSTPAKRTHLIKEHGYQRTEFKCKLCEKVFCEKGPLKRHVRSVHLQERNFECDVCHNAFMRKSELKDHMKYHKNIREFSCSFCKKDFVTRYQLKRHMAAHDESYKHTCAHCGGSYTQKYYLNLHMKKCSGTNKRAKVAEDGVQEGVGPL